MMMKTLLLISGFLNASLTQCLVVRAPQRGFCTSFARSLVLETRNPRSSTRLFAVQEQKKNFIESIVDPVPTKIPKEMRAEIEQAEANTQAAKERSTRIVGYAILAVAGILAASFNAFLTELRETVDPDVISKVNEMIPESEAISNQSLSDFGFGWVESNFLFSFLFLTRVGGGLSLVSGAACGLLIEAELETKRQYKERIWEEIERRQSSTVTQKRLQPKKQKTKRGRKGQRMDALSEVVFQDEADDKLEESTPERDIEESEQKSDDGGIFGKVKGFYEKADSMAASQALLFNKELEDRGIVDKITDETGLKVIGKEAASKIEAEKSREKEPESD